MEQQTVRFRNESEARLIRVIAAYNGVSTSSWIRDAAIEKMHQELPSLIDDVKGIAALVIAQYPELPVLDTNS